MCDAKDTFFEGVQTGRLDNHCMKVNFYVLYGSIKNVYVLLWCTVKFRLLNMPLWPTVNGAFMVFEP